MRGFRDVGGAHILKFPPTKNLRPIVAIDMQGFARKDSEGQSTVRVDSEVHENQESTVA